MPGTTPNAVRILTYPIDEAVLQKLGNRRRNQLFGCMHAHNELSFLNRLLLFTQNSTADGELHDHAQSIQMWCVLQILAGKLFETWQMLAQRILRAKPTDPIIAALCLDHQAALAWLRGYFGGQNLKDNAIKLVRDKTAFHYELGQQFVHYAMTDLPLRIEFTHDTETTKQTPSSAADSS